MSSMNFMMEKLLDGVEIEWKPLKEVAEVRSGWGFPNAYQGKSEGIYPFYKVSDMNIVGNETQMGIANNYIDDAVVKKLGVTLAPAGTVIFPKIGAAVATNKKRLLSMPSAYDNNVMGLISSGKISARFLFYWMQTINLSSLAHDSGAVPSIRKSEMEALPIPIPCPENSKKSLEIQAEIVRILDAFSAMTAELIAELTVELSSRKKQYNYYRDQLLSFEKGEIECKPLGEVANFANGKGHEKDIVEDGEYVVINSKFISTNGQVAKNSNKQICPLFINDILLVMSDLPNGKALAKTFIVDANDRYTLNQRIGGISVKNKNELLPKFLYHFLNRNPQLMKYDNGVDQTNLRKDQILGVQIPILSITEQKRICSILDKFDALTNSISESLPREIALRQKQYEYYRDLLLSFPKQEEVAV